MSRSYLSNLARQLLKPAASSTVAPANRRFLSDAKSHQSDYILAAERYPAETRARDWFYAKPFDLGRGGREHGDFYLNMFNALALLKAMRLPPGAHILEVGCGPGWLTEILALLGYRVTAFDPSNEFVAIARDRLERAAHHHMAEGVTDNVSFIVGTIENLDFEASIFDAIVFYDVLHHVIDEHAALANCSKWLKPDGALGVIEGAWSAGNEDLERQLREEMARFGTLESPFTTEYLDHLLQLYGFSEIQRLTGICGMVPTDRLNKPLAELVTHPPSSRNDLVARKQAEKLYAFDPATDFVLSARILSSVVSKGAVQIELSLRNEGKCILRGGNTLAFGQITFALRKGPVGDAAMRESLNRILLPSDLLPGESFENTLTFFVPEGDEAGWFFEVIAEQVAWLSRYGFSTVLVS